MPGGAEKAGEPEGDDHAVEEREVEGKDSCSADARVGEVHVWFAVVGGGVVRGIEAVHPWSCTGKIGGQGEDIGQGFGGFVSGRGAQALNVIGTEVVNRSLQTGYPNNPTRSIIRILRS